MSRSHGIVRRPTHISSEIVFESAWHEAGGRVSNPFIVVQDLLLALGHTCAHALRSIQEAQRRSEKAPILIRLPPCLVHNLLRAEPYALDWLVSFVIGPKLMQCFLWRSSSACKTQLCPKLFRQLRDSGCQRCSVFACRRGVLLEQACMLRVIFVGK